MIINNLETNVHYGSIKTSAGAVDPLNRACRLPEVELQIDPNTVRLPKVGVQQRTNKMSAVNLPLRTWSASGRSICESPEQASPAEASGRSVWTTKTLARHTASLCGPAP